MGVMTASTGRSFYRIAGMGFFERAFLIIMAGTTNRCFFIFKKVGFIRAMSEVAERASLFPQSFMHSFLFKRFFFVALIAKRFAFSL